MINRDSYKPSKIEAQNETKKSNGPKMDFLSINDGKNKFRLYPFHPNGGGSSFYELKSCVYLPIYMDKRDAAGNIETDSSGNVVKILKKKQIYSASVHCIDKSKDIIQQYISFAEKIANVTYSNELEVKKYLAPIFNPMNGLLPNMKYCVYADKYESDGTKKFGRLEIPKAVKIRLNSIAAIEDSNEPLGLDPFTDINDGRAIIIMYNKNATRPGDYYQTEIDTTVDKKTKMLVTYPLTDEDLITFEKYEPLYKQFHNSYRLRDFDFSIQGLRNFDKANNLGVFAYDEFIAICEEFRNFFIGLEPDNSNTKIEKNVESKEESVDQFDVMSKSELIDYCLDNGIKVNSKMEIDQIKATIRNTSKATINEPKIESANTIVNESKKSLKENTDFLKEVPKSTLPEVDDLPWNDDGSNKKTTIKTVVELKEDKTQPKLSIQERLAKLRNQGK